MKRSLQTTTLLLIGAFMVGCGGGGVSSPLGKPVPVKGKVTLASGSPLTTGTVAFVSSEPGKSDDVFGVVDSSGNFSTTVYPGKYRMAVEPPWVRGGGKAGGTQIPAKFQKAATAELEVEVPSSGKEDISITLK